MFLPNPSKKLLNFGVEIISGTVCLGLQRSWMKWPEWSFLVKKISVWTLMPFILCTGIFSFDFSGIFSLNVKLSVWRSVFGMGTYSFEKRLGPGHTQGSRDSFCSSTGSLKSTWSFLDIFNALTALGIHFVTQSWPSGKLCEWKKITYCLSDGNVIGYLSLSHPSLSWGPPELTVV